MNCRAQNPVNTRCSVRSRNIIAHIVVPALLLERLLREDVACAEEYGRRHALGDHRLADERRTAEGGSELAQGKLHT